MLQISIMDIYNRFVRYNYLLQTKNMSGTYNFLYFLKDDEPKVEQWKRKNVCKQYMTKFIEIKIER